MATVTGMTADRMLAIEQASVVDGDVVGDNLILVTKGGTQINAGSVRGNPGPAGPMGTALSVVSAQPVLDVGVINQIRAGRQLSATDFTKMGLAAPAGLWNLSDLTDASGNGRNLSNKGAVPFGVGIMGSAAGAAVYAGANTQVLYIPDTGAADPFRIKIGSFGCWFRTAKRATTQALLSKWGASGQMGWELYIGSTVISADISLNGAAGTVGVDFVTVNGATDVTDDKWHFAVATNDGTRLRVYIDGALEGSTASSIGFGPSAPLNVGGRQGDAATVSAIPHYGRVDEAFVTSDILSDEQIRNLYCAKLPHALAAQPSSVLMSVRRRRRGGTLLSADFPSQPLRLHNFTAGAVTDEGSQAQVLANPLPGQGVVTPATGADGTKENGYHMSGPHAGLGSTDTGLPSGLASRSYGAWFKTLTPSGTLIGWGGSLGANDVRIVMAANGYLVAYSGGDFTGRSGAIEADGLWHHAVCVEDNAAADGVKRKFYIDGRLVGISTVMNSINLAGANGFRVGSNPTVSTAPVTGQIDGAFVYAGVLTAEQVRALYNKGTQQLAPSLKAAADHVEAQSTTDILVALDTLESSDLVDLAVAA